MSDSVKKYFDNMDEAKDHKTTITKPFFNGFNNKSFYYDVEKQGKSLIGLGETKDGKVYMRYTDSYVPEHVEEGKKETEGKTPMELDWSFIKQMAERTAQNKKKYPPYNWKKPMDIDKLKDSLMRHLLEVMEGNYEDDGREMGHLEAIALNAQYINYQLKNNQG